MRKNLMLFATAAALILGPAFRAVAVDESEMARVEGLLGDEASVVEKVRAYDRLHQKLADIHGRRGEALQKEGNKEEADKELRRANDELLLCRQAYETALERHPGLAGLHNYYGELLFDRFDEQKAGVEQWQKAVELDPKTARACNNLGIYQCHAGQYVEGLANLDKAVLLEPENPDYQYNLAQIYLTNWPQVVKIRNWTSDQVYKAAMTASETAARLAPTDFDLVVDYARNFFTAGQMGAQADWEAAAKAWQHARTLARNDDERFNAWLNEARVWYKAGKGGAVEKCCEQALRIRPQSLVAKELLTMSQEAAAGKHGK